VGLEFAAIIIAGAILTVFAFQSGPFERERDLTAFPAVIQATTLPTVIASISSPTVISVTTRSQAVTPVANELPTSTPTLIQAVVDNTTTTQSAYEFDFSNANQVLPDDIIQETAFFSGLGGGGEWCANEETKLRILQVPDQKMEVMNSISVEICGVAPEETLKIRILYPNGIEKVWDESIAADEHSFSFSYPTSLDDPVGTYTIVISGKNGEVTFQQIVIAPGGPRLHHLDNNWIFYNFRPNERIRVVAYDTEFNCNEQPEKKCMYAPSFWEEYFADGSGKLIITSEEKNIMAIGEFAGKVTSYSGYWYHGFPVFMGGEYCPNSPPSLNLQPGDWVMVIDDLAWVDSVEWPASMNVAGESDENVPWDSNSKIYVPKGTVFRVGSYITIGDCEGFGKPAARALQIYCDIGMDYCAQNKPTTVIPEGFKDQYFIRSISRPDDSTPLACGNKLKSGLQIGNDALVTDPEGLGLKMTPYETDYLNSTTIKMLLPQGTRIKFVAGPICNQAGLYPHYEWFAQTDTGFDGWVIEGSSLKLAP